METIGRPIYLFMFFRFIIIIMPTLKIMKSKQRTFFDDPKFWQSNEFLICVKFQEERNMHYLLFTLCEYLAQQDMEALYIAIPPMRETILILMETHSLRRVRFIVEKQINTDFMEKLYALQLATGRDEVQNRMDDCWEHWKLIVDGLDLKTNTFCSFSGVMDQTDLEHEMGCTPINCERDPADLYQTEYEILCINILIYDGAELFELDRETGERCEEMDVRYSFCGHVITKNGEQLKSCIKEALKGPDGLMDCTRVKYTIRKVGKPRREDRFNGKKYKMIQSFVDQGHMTEEDLVRRDCVIYDENGDMVRPANREKDITCTECQVRIDSYGQRPSSAVSTIVGWTRKPDFAITNMRDIIEREGLWMESRQHTSRRSTSNARLFKGARINFGNDINPSPPPPPPIQDGEMIEKVREIPEVRSEEAEVETEANVAGVSSTSISDFSVLVSVPAVWLAAAEEMIEMDQEIVEVWRDEWEVEMDEE